MSAISHSDLPLEVVAQTGPNVDVEVDPGVGVVGGAVGAFLTTLVVGGIMIAVVPEYTERMTGLVLAEPVGAFVYGVVALLLVVAVAVIIAITIIAILLALPLALVAYVVWAVGAAIAYSSVWNR